MKFIKKFFKPKKNHLILEAEKEFKKGEIILLSGLMDYQDYNDFKSKTSHLNNIQEELKVIEEDDINGK